jgi:teichoic acid transport system ATP-binding protein
MSSDTIISVEGIGKKFCRSPKRAMLYGLRDIASDLLGISQSSNGLRPDEFWALKEVSFEVKRGECVGLIGRNGAGKSTLLKLLSGITLPDTGSITIAGRVGSLLELGAGFHPMLTGRENVYLSGSILGLCPAEIANKFEAIVDFAGLGEFIDTPVKYYSSGMYVRLGFAIAAHADQDVLLVDEALGIGDIFFQSKCYTKLREFKKRGLTVLFVSHNVDLITANCDRGVLIDKGRIIKDGPPKSVVDEFNKLGILDNGTVGNRQATAGSPGGIPKEWSELFNVNPEGDRYGTREAEILEAGIFTSDHAPVQRLQRGQEYYIKVKVRHNQAMPAAIVSFVIKGSTGMPLCGTNTYFERAELGWMEKGAIVLVTFKHRVRLNPGEYLLSIGCQGLGAQGYVPYDRRIDYLAFSVIAEVQRHGIFDPETLVSWSVTGS